jgi:hypothetical protein
MQAEPFPDGCYPAVGSAYIYATDGYLLEVYS